MVDYRLKITIYNEICNSESITPTVKKIYPSYFVNRSIPIFLWVCAKIGLNDQKISNFLDSLERE